MLDWSKYSCGAAVGDTHFEKHGSLTGSKLARAARRPTQILQSGTISGYKPAIHDRYLSRDRRSCPRPSSRRWGFVSSRFLKGRGPVRLLSGAYFVLVQFGFFSAPSFCVWLRSTAKRDQSFIFTYPAFSEGLHGRLSLGNPPALKQCFWCIGRACPPLHRPVYSKDRRELALAESKLPCHRHALGAILASNRSDSISSLDSWSGCRPLDTSTTDNETFPFRRAASCWLARRPASSPSSINTSLGKRSTSNCSCTSERLTPSKATTLG